MEGYHPLGKIIHLPTWFLIIGYPVFWLQLYTHQAPYGVTSPLPWILWGMMAIWFLIHACRDEKENPIKQFLVFVFSLNSLEKILWIIGLGILLFMASLIVLAGLKPIHLIQEFDCLQYHYTLPRQHLITGSFEHIPWAADDLFLLPIDFALAPFWFVTSLPNKIPQLFFLFGLIAVAIRLTLSLASAWRPWVGVFIVFLIMGTHGFTIQMGTGMLDLVTSYLLLACLDSLHRGKWFLAGVEFTFFFWSKPLMPLGVIVSLAILAVLFIIANANRWKMTGSLALKGWKKALIVFAVLSVPVAGPFIAKSMVYAGTPFFPMAPALTQAKIQDNPLAWESLEKASQLWQENKDNYGHGRDIGAFIKHLWLLAVPEKGVNNSFDYPMGLTYLLMLPPFLFLLGRNFLHRQFSPLSLLAVIGWLLWWFGPQQARFLYLPLLIIFIVVIAQMERVSKVLLACVLFSLCLAAISLWGAHKRDIGLWGIDVLREQDKKLLELNRQYMHNPLAQGIEQPFHDVAYAQFPVVVRKENLPHTIRY